MNHPSVGFPHESEDQTQIMVPRPVRKAWWIGPFGISWRLSGREPGGFYQKNRGHRSIWVRRIRLWYWPIARSLTERLQR